MQKRSGSRSDCGRGGVEIVAVDAVQTQIGDAGEAIVGRNRDGVWVGFVLPIRLRAEWALMRDEAPARPEPAVGFEGERADLAATVTHGDENFAGMIHRRVAQRGVGGLDV